METGFTMKIRMKIQDLMKVDISLFSKFILAAVALYGALVKAGGYLL